MRGRRVKPATIHYKPLNVPACEEKSLEIKNTKQANKINLVKWFNESFNTKIEKDVLYNKSGRKTKDSAESTKPNMQQIITPIEPPSEVIRFFSDTMKNFPDEQNDFIAYFDSDFDFYL